MDITALTVRLSHFGINMATLRELYNELYRRPFPVLAKDLPDFVLFDSLIAGCVDRVCNGGRVSVSEIATADLATTRQIAQLRSKELISCNERALLEYFDLLERVRASLLEESETQTRRN